MINVPELDKIDTKFLYELATSPVNLERLENHSFFDILNIQHSIEFVFASALYGLSGNNYSVVKILTYRDYQEQYLKDFTECIETTGWIHMRSVIELLNLGMERESVAIGMSISLKQIDKIIELSKKEE